MKNEESASNGGTSTTGNDSSLFTHHSSLEDLQNLRDGLYALISDVLFVRDNKNADLFHPRISVQFDFIYESLYDSDKAIFNRLYNDYFYRRNNQFWYFEAMKKLPRLVDATRMLVCAEDLGMVPDCVAWVMNELRILSLELQSMPKDPNIEPRYAYAPPVVGRGLGPHAGLLQLNALSWRCRSASAAGLVGTRHHITASHKSVDAVHPEHSGLARH